MVIAYKALPQRVIRTHVETMANYEWVREHMEEIRRDYPDKFIAVVDGKVVYNTKVYTDLLNYLSEHRDRPDLIATRVRASGHMVLR
jgi:predicted Holliday junction resolvase-like endonuclease